MLGEEGILGRGCTAVVLASNRAILAKRTRRGGLSHQSERVVCSLTTSQVTICRFVKRPAMRYQTLNLWKLRIKLSAARDFGESVERR